MINSKNKGNKNSREENGLRKVSGIEARPAHKWFEKFEFLEEGFKVPILNVSV